MSPIKNKISQLFKSKKLNVFVLFFIISLTILILSKLSQNYQGTLVFKVKPTNAKETQVILNDTSNQLKITLDTYGFKWLRYAINKPTVEVDLESDVILKDSTLIWTEKKGFSNISKADQIEVQREYFISLSEEIISISKQIQQTQKLFIQKCPMANNNQGAKWLSLEEEIKNPYYGASMLGCGSVIDVIN